MSVTSPWPEVGKQLDIIFKKQMFYHQRFKNDKFWKSFVPDDPELKGYFGTKVLNIFIAQKPYGWVLTSPDNYTFTWPPEGLIDDMNKFNDEVKNFTSYNTLIWVDTWTAAELQRESPQSDMPEMMERTNTAIQALCDSYSMLTYMGKLTTPVESNYFEERVRKFFGKPNFRKPEEP